MGILEQSFYFPHTCEEESCSTVVRFDDEPYCFIHSPDSGSTVIGYSARAKAESLNQHPTNPLSNIEA